MNFRMKSLFFLVILGACFSVSTAEESVSTGNCEDYKKIAGSYMSLQMCKIGFERLWMQSLNRMLAEGAQQGNIRRSQLRQRYLENLEKIVRERVECEKKVN